MVIETHASIIWFISLHFMISFNQLQKLFLRKDECTILYYGIDNNYDLFSDNATALFVEVVGLIN